MSTHKSAEQHMSTPPPLPSGFEVLIVDDELRIRNMLTVALKSMGFRSTTASTAEAALKEITRQAFDILMLDLNLPGMDGLEFLKSIRQKYPDLQVIILTGFGDLQAAKTAIHLDVVEFLTKPYTLGDLEIALDRARKRRKAKLMSELPVVIENVIEPDSVNIPSGPQPAAAGGEAIEDLERRAILQSLEKHNGNRAAAAEEMGISLRKLYYRLKEYDRKGLS